jgi:hypothetical protein
MTPEYSAAAARVVVTPDILRPFGAASSLSSIAAALLSQQQTTWPLLKAGYASLNSVQSREFAFDGFVMRVQFNPGRIISSSAKVDEKSIRERKCFLCLPHLPEEQRGVAFGEDYVLLCNPFPIFPEHFTVPHKQHVPQKIDESFGALLELSEALHDRYTVFYNGPRCGASAPDHLHFQAGLKGFMPLDTEYSRVVRQYGRIARDEERLKWIVVDDSLRRFVVLESASRDALEKGFGFLLRTLQAIAGGGDEPMLNILVRYEQGWKVLVFPRAVHRPSFFFAEGDEKILISPAAVDLGGVCITPVEKDFHRVTRQHIEKMFGEIMLGEKDFGELEKSIR